jgi:hypothetical protein
MPSAVQRPAVKVDELRDRIAEALAGSVKSYDLPRICVSLGLPPGEEQEAYQSKRLYVRKRLLGLSRGQLLRIAGEIVKEYETPALEDVLSELTTHAKHRISELTRREILKITIPLDPLFGDLARSGIDQNLSVLSPPWNKPSESGHVFRTLADDVQQHYVRNPEDWSNLDLLERCGALTCSQERFMALVEKLLDPMARRGHEQKELVAAFNEQLFRDGFKAEVVGQQSGYSVYGIRRVDGGVTGTPKNLIFASIGEKPELILRDAINNDVEVVKFAEKCLIYDRPLLSSGLLWVEMADWWMERNKLKDLKIARKSLGERLLLSVQLTKSPGEYAIFRTYYELFGLQLGDGLPALIPQVYLHYDPMTVKQRGRRLLVRQRMDFLMLLQWNVRVVIEVDGKQHYSEAEKVSPTLYGSMVAEDRELRLRGYEVYRFGGAEFRDTVFEGKHCSVGSDSRAIVRKFFTDLFGRHGIVLPQESR